MRREEEGIERKSKEKKKSRSIEGRRAGEENIGINYWISS